MIDMMNYVLEKLHKVLGEFYGGNSSEEPILALIEADKEKFGVILKHLGSQQDKNNTLLMEMLAAVYGGNIQALHSKQFSEPKYLETIETLILNPQLPNYEFGDNYIIYHPNVSADDIF